MNETNKDKIVKHLVEMYDMFAKAKQLPDKYKEPTTDQSALLEIEPHVKEIFARVITICKIIDTQMADFELNANPHTNKDVDDEDTKE